MTKIDLLNEIEGINISLEAVSGLRILRQGSNIFISASGSQFPVDSRKFSNNIIPLDSGAINLGQNNLYWRNIYVNTVNLGNNKALVTSNNIKNGWGLSGIQTGEDVYLYTSGFLAESGISVTRNKIDILGFHAAGTSTAGTIGVFTVNSSGTTVNPNDNKRLSLQYDVGTTTTNVAAYGYYGTAATSIKNTIYNLDARFDLRIINSGSMQFYAGFINANPNNISPDLFVASRQYIALALRSSGNWQFISCNGSAQFIVEATGMPIDTEWHDIHIYSDNNGTAYHLLCDDKYIASISQQLPLSGANLGWLTQMATVTSNDGLNKYRVSYLHVVANSANPLVNQVM